ncbi:NAD(P)-dependent oxidoreductase [Romboutsia ilealis]|uniref:NAD(P)-dependent oxidoreductase n=1 Tax=Romboutsia ilealis TaxID=1115758 RepID=UPI002730F033|nr:NAD(P)-dependent oxidoreductase [Romboutsia ilealis]
MKVIDINELREEANKCFTCKVPKCKKNCPIDTPIPEIIQLFKENKIEEAGEILFNNNPLSAICGVVCPHEDQCLGNCIRGIKDKPVGFYEIERFISSNYLKNVKLKQEDNLNERIAIIGSYKVTIFEKRSHIGGVLRYGIPKFRLPEGVLDDIENILLDLNVKIRYNALVGPVITIDKLFEDGYDAIFIGTGVWNPKPLNIKGETFGHVHYAIDYLKSPNSYRLGDNVIIIGAGNVAMDAARTAKYHGVKNVTVVYRKDFEDMTATKAEINDAKKEGVNFELFKSPVEITDEGAIFIDTKKLDDERKTMVNIEGSEKLIKADSVIIAISQSPKNNIVSNTKNLDTNKYGLLVTDDKGHTTRDGVFASGDVVTGAKTVVEAVANAKEVANSIEEYLKLKKM